MTSETSPLGAQRTLDEHQIRRFRKDICVDDQVAHFSALTSNLGLDKDKTIVDIGGGCGFFAAALSQQFGFRTRVLDADRESVEICRRLHQATVDAVQADALDPPVSGDETVACFNLILHHLVADTEAETRELQKRALVAWKGRAAYMFINEYVYESFLGSVSGRIIYEITKSRRLSALASLVARFIPTLKANTLGVGVRFRSHKDWLKVFEECGLEVVGRKLGDPEVVSPARRFLLLKSTTRDSYLLRSAL